MDKQMKRGFIEASVLAILARGESYGYQIVRDAPAALELSESTLYPVLKRLEQAGCVATRSAEHNGRLRKYYRIERPGIDRLLAFLDERADVMSVYRFVERAAAGIAPESPDVDLRPRPAAAAAPAMPAPQMI